MRNVLQVVGQHVEDVQFESIECVQYLIPCKCSGFKSRKKTSKGGGKKEPPQCSAFLLSFTAFTELHKL